MKTVPKRQQNFKRTETNDNKRYNETDEPNDQLTNVENGQSEASELKVYIGSVEGKRIHADNLNKIVRKIGGQKHTDVQTCTG